MIKKLFKLLFSRIFVIMLLILVQFAVIFVPLYVLNRSTFFNIFFWVVGILVVLYVIKQDIEPSFKLVWTIVILLLPVLGSGLYFIFGDKQHVNKSIRKSHDYRTKSHHLLIGEIKQDNISSNHSALSNDVMAYLQNQGFPAHNNTNIAFFPWGVDKFNSLLIDLKNAKEFIFLEYFIIDEGYMWDTILDILKQKVKEGVEVRLIYDGFGCLTTLPHNYDKKINSFGIKCRIFNEIKPMITFKVNNRDHRKILIIDGKYGYTGGINLADEYINKINRFGVWKDTAIRLEGDAVYSLTFLFLQMWNSIKDDNEDYQKYHIPSKIKNNNLVIPFGDDPTDKERVGENVYIKIFNQAKKYVYLTTPYLICDDTINSAITLAAKSNVEIFIITPGIYDKKMVSWLTKSSYHRLLKAGVRIFEYSKGFVHAKQYVSDDKIAMVGTINMDYRSFYHHYECSTYIEDEQLALSVKEDILNLIKECKEIKLDEIKDPGIIKRLFTDILRIFAPLM